MTWEVQQKSRSAGASVTGNSADSDSASAPAIFEDSQITEIGESDNTSARPTGAVLLQPFHICEFETETFLPTQLENFVKAGHISFPMELPIDIGNHIFPIYVFKAKCQMGNHFSEIGLIKVFKRIISQIAFNMNSLDFVLLKFGDKS
ncbi:hypothetical protein CHS0354_035486 [Potamilus streckersoni]|uniref:Uncharacterized protein n=1 Tax=Potamilus streckersoni TaxID=2493646 RepID=A0AAE0RVS0_9BIVA|nr:hypothetical protein CHS0354_035486 [Potamilus streckersoni]